MQKQELLAQVSAMIEELQGVDFDIPEDTGYFSIEDNLVRRVRSLAREAANLMRDIMDAYDAEVSEFDDGDDPQASGESFLKDIGAQISSHMAVQEVSGLAFVSRGQMLDMLSALDNSVHLKQIWKVASNADGLLRRTGRALIAIESAMRECEGLPVEFRQWQDIDDSLEVRRSYSEFRRAILAISNDEPESCDAPEQMDSGEVRRRLQLATKHIDDLRSMQIYPYLRIDDRLEIRRLQKRIHAWLTENHSTDSGSQLWSDLVSFARLLAHVNLREELREHDRLTVDGLWRRWYGSGPGESVELTPGNLALLEPLLGREDDLDAIILKPDKFSGADIRPHLERLRQELGRPFSSPAEGLLPPSTDA